MGVYVPVNLKDISRVDGLLDEDNLAAAGEGSQVYIRTEDVPPQFDTGRIAMDQVTVSPSNTFTSESAIAAARIISDDPNYIRNLNEGDPQSGQTALYDTYGAGGPDGADGAGGSGDAGEVGSGDITQDIQDAVDQYSNELNNLENGLKDTDYCINEDGDLIPDSQKLEALFKEVMRLVYILQALLIAADTHNNNMFNAARLMGKIRAVGGSVSVSHAGKMLQTSAQNLNIFVGQVFASALEVDMNNYQKEYSDADRFNAEFMDQVWDFFSGGANSMKVVEARIEASEKFMRLIEKILGSLLRVLASFSPAAKDAVSKLGSVFVDGDNGYIDIDGKALGQLRDQIALDQDGPIAYAEAVLSKIDANPQAAKILYEIRNSRSFRHLVISIATEAKAHVLGLFDQVTNLLMLKKQVFNQINYDKLQLEKLKDSQVWNIISGQLMIGAIVCSIVASFFTFGSTAFIALSLCAVFSGLLSAATRWIAAEVVNSLVDDEFIPLDQTGMLEPVLDMIDDTGDEIIDFIASLDRKEKQLINQPNSGMLMTASDGYKQIDYQAFVGITDERELIQMTRDLMVQLKVQQSEMALQAAKILCGVDGTSGRKLVADAKVDSIDGRRDLDLELAKSTLTDMKNAFNQQHAEAIAMRNATTSFLMSSGFAILGGCASAALGGSMAFFGIGYGIMSAVGGSLAEVINAQTSLGVTYDRDNEVVAMLQEKISDPAGNDFDRWQDTYLIELLKETKINIGRGRKDLSSQRIVEIQKTLGALEAAKSLWIELKNAPVEAARDYAYSEAGISPSENNLTEKIETRSGKALSKKISYALTICREGIEVANRAARASEAAESAGINFGINLGIAAVMCGAAALSSFSTAMVLVQLAAPVMNLVTGIYNAVHSWQLSQRDFGELEADIGLAKNVRKSQVHSDELSDTTDRIDAIETKLIAEATEKMLSKYGLNSGFFGSFQAKISVLYEIKNQIFKLLDLEQAALIENANAMMDGMGKNHSFMKKAGYQRQLVAFAAVENILNSMRVMGERFREMDQANLAMWKSTFSAALSAVQVVMTGIRTVRTERAFELQREGKTAIPGKNYSPELAAIQASNRFWNPMSITLNCIKILNSFSQTITNQIYREAKGTKKGEAPERYVAQSSGKKGIGASLDHLETIKVDAQIAAGCAALDREATLEYAEQVGELMHNSVAFIENAVEVYNQRSKEKAEDEKKLVQPSLRDKNNPVPDNDPVKEMKERVKAAPAHQSPVAMVNAERKAQESVRTLFNKTRNIISSC